MSLERKRAKQIDSFFFHLPVGEDFFVTSALTEDLTAPQKCPDRHTFTFREGELPSESSCSLIHSCKEQGQSTPPLLSMGVIIPLQQLKRWDPPWEYMI